MKYKDKKINDVPSFLKWVKAGHQIENIADDGFPLPFTQDTIYYRGQANNTWELSPAVFRKYIQEHELLRKAELSLWNEVAQCRSYLEKLIYFQHYGLWTRLLDVTSNPLIALYMACDDEKERKANGVIYTGTKGYTKDVKETAIAELTAEFVFTSSFNNFPQEFKDFVKENQTKPTYFTHPILIQPPINNPRIEAQNGAFILAPLIENEQSEIPYKGNLDNSGFFGERRALIPATSKIAILKELNELGINKGSIYKGTSEKLQSIIQEELWKF